MFKLLFHFEIHQLINNKTFGYCAFLDSNSNNV